MHINIEEYFVLYYKHKKPLACTFSGHPYVHPQALAIQRMYYGNFKINEQM
jgi:hypothetical protein